MEPAQSRGTVPVGGGRGGGQDGRRWGGDKRGGAGQGGSEQPLEFSVDSESAGVCRADSPDCSGGTRPGTTHCVKIMFHYCALVYYLGKGSNH